MVDAEKRKRRLRNERYYQKKKVENQQAKDEAISEHLEKFPLDLNYGQKPVRDSYPSFREWLDLNPNGEWKQYAELIEILKEDQPRQLTDAEMQPYLRATSEGLCSRCHEPLPEGYDGKVCMDCRCEISN